MELQSQKMNLCLTIFQEALSKAAGKKTKTPVQLDLGDMLAALEKQQQAMKARQITNTRPLAHPGEALVCLHSVLQPLGYSYILSPYSVLDPLPLKRECGCPCHVEHVDV